MKKKLNEIGITNELRGNSAYFQSSAAPEVEEITETKPRKRTSSARKTTMKVDSVVTPVDTAPVESPAAQPMGPTPQAVPVPAAADTMLPPNQDQLIETIRRAVKRLGKEATFCRFTQEEKNTLSDIIYTYKRSGTRTSENEVIRIAVNWLLENYQSAEQNSVLAQVLEKLNA